MTATPSRDRPPVALSATITDYDAARVLVEVQRSATTQGALEVVFCGGPDLADCVTVSTPPPSGGQIPVYVVRDVPHTVTLRLIRRDDRWEPAIGTQAYHYIRRVRGNDYATGAAYQAILAACMVAADAALAALPLGWATAEVRFLAQRLDSCRRAVATAEGALDAARQQHADTQAKLTHARNTLAILAIGEASGT